MSSQRTSATKPKTVNKKPFSPAITSKASAVNEHKQPVHDTRAIKTEPNAIVINPQSEQKDFPALVPDCTIDITKGVDLNTSELSIIKMLEGEIQQEGIEEEEERKIREEIANVKRDIAMKNALVERLMKENSDVRREMDELLATVENAKDKINVKLKICNQRIQDLETEITHLKRENQMFQEQLLSYNNKEKGAKPMRNLEDHVVNYYAEAKQRIAMFYMKLNEQMSELFGSRKEHHQHQENLNLKLQSSVPETKKEINAKMNSKHEAITKNQIKGKTAAATAANTPTTKSSSLAKNRANSIASLNTISTPVRERISSANNTSRRRRMVTLNNANEVTPVNRSESCKNLSSKTDVSAKSFKFPNTPSKQIKGLARINSLNAEEEEAG